MLDDLSSKELRADEAKSSQVALIRIWDSAKIFKLRASPFLQLFMMELGT